MMVICSFYFEIPGDVHASYNRNMGEREKAEHTSNTPHGLRALTSGEKDHISLIRAHIVVFEEEDLVNTILLEGAEFDEQSDSPCERLFDH